MLGGCQRYVIVFWISALHLKNRKANVASTFTSPLKERGFPWWYFPKKASFYTYNSGGEQI